MLLHLKVVNIQTGTEKLLKSFVSFSCPTNNHCDRINIFYITIHTLIYYCLKSTRKSVCYCYLHLHGVHCASLYSQYTAAPTTVAPTAAEMMLGVVPFATSIVGIILLSILVLLLAMFTTCMYYRRSHHRPGSYYVIELSTAHKTIQLHVKQSLFL